MVKISIGLTDSIDKLMKLLKMKVNPYLILGISKDALPVQTKSIFRKKLFEARNNDELRAKICIAYDIIVNKNYYIECENDMYILNLGVENSNVIPAYHYTIIGDCFHLMEEIEKNEKLLSFKDPLERNLLYIAARNGHVNACEYLINKGIKVNELQKHGSTPLHGAAYYGQTNVVKLLLSYGAKTNIKNKLGNLPIDEAMTEEIKNILKEGEKDPILKLYQTLNSKSIAKKMIPISSKGNIIAKKIVCDLINLPKEYKLEEVEREWLTAWHGTNSKVLESIAEIGLKPAGGINKNGEEIQVCVSHIERERTVDEIQDWANGIFVSPSIFYCCHEAYAKEICCNNEQYKVLVEVRVKPNSYKEHISTCPSYIPKNGEPVMLEYRIAANNEKDVQVYSLTFVKNEFLETIKEYKEGEIFKKK